MVPKRGKKKKGRSYFSWEDDFKYVAGKQQEKVENQKYLQEASILGQAVVTKLPKTEFE